MNKKQTRKQTLLDLDASKMSEAGQDQKITSEIEDENQTQDHTKNNSEEENIDEKNQNSEKEETEEEQDEKEETQKMSSSADTQKQSKSSDPGSKDNKVEKKKEPKKRKADSKKKSIKQKKPKSSKNSKDTDSENSNTSEESDEENSFRKNGLFDYPFKSISVGNKGPIRAALNKILKLQSLLQDVDSAGGEFLVEYVNEISDLKIEISQIIKERNKAKLEQAADKEKLKTLKEYLQFMIQELRDERCGSFATIILGLAQDSDVAEILGSRKASRMVLKCKESKKNFKNLGSRSLDQVQNWNKKPKSNNFQNNGPRNRYGQGNSRQNYGGYYNNSYNNGYYGGNYGGNGNVGGYRGSRR